MTDFPQELFEIKRLLAEMDLQIEACREALKIGDQPDGRERDLVVYLSKLCATRSQWDKVMKSLAARAQGAD